MSDTTLYGLAKEMFDETGNAERAITKMVDYIEADPKLYKALAAPAIRMAAASAVQSVIGATRSAIIGHRNPSPASASTVRGYQLHGTWVLMNFPLAGGKPLGKATKSEILEHVAFQQKSVDTQQINLDWLRAVANELSTAGARVEHELKEADLARIRRRVEGASWPVSAA